jgi:hypothetical protein
MFISINCKMGEKRHFIHCAYRKQKTRGKFTLHDTKVKRKGGKSDSNKKSEAAQNKISARIFGYCIITLAISC